MDNIKSLHNPSLYEALKKKDEFLKQYPHMQEFQDKIDDMLVKSGTNNRLAVIHNLMLAHAITLAEECGALAKETAKVGKLLSDK